MDYDHLLERCYAGHRYLLAMDVLAGTTSLVADLRRFGADDMFVVSGFRGIGPIPEDVPSVLLGAQGTSLMDGIRRFERALGDLDAGPSDVAAAIEAFDPEGVARVIGSLFMGLTSVAGRRVYGAREASWRALEDKTVIDVLWDAADVPRAPSRVVACEPAALRAASDDLDDGAGVVWVADNRLGWHGGASGLRWVRSPADIGQAAANLAEQADTVRAMPFLDGIPCSIHGCVFDDRTAVFRPCEMVVLRRPGRTDLLYAGTATTWDPPPQRRHEMRAVTRRVGDHLRVTVGYRGFFALDGVMTARGFRPTELNPRFGAAANRLAAAAKIPLYLLHMAVVEREPIDWRPRHLEEQVVAAADAQRSASSFVDTPNARDGEVALAWEDGELRATTGDAADVTVAAGASRSGGVVRVFVDAQRHVRGRSAAPAVVAALAWADEHWDLGLGPLAPAPDVTG